jgi:hypothetical protein
MSLLEESLVARFRKVRLRDVECYQDAMTLAVAGTPRQSPDPLGEEAGCLNTYLST